MSVTLTTRPDLEAYLKANSHLPGPRANLALAMRAGEELDLPVLKRLAGSEDEFLALCGAIGLGRLRQVKRLRALAADSRWRVREGVALGLQRWGDDDFASMLAAVRPWTSGSRLEQRAVVAALCEPRLLRDRAVVGEVLDVLEAITASVAGRTDRRTEEFRVLRQALGYGWSVAVAAAPEIGLSRFGALERLDDPDVVWIVRENLKKSRLSKLLP